MCGIFGWIDNKITLQHAERMVHALRHRGPNDNGWMAYKEGAWRDNRKITALDTTADVVLGQTRLSIIDLSEKGHQPMQTADARFVLTFNGEVYNYLELKKELKKEGYTFQTDTDTEVVLYAWQAWGMKALKRFTGMFALAIFDNIERTLTLARDPFGIKPLYYCQQGKSLYFASEVPAMLQFEAIPKHINWQWATDYLLQGGYDLDCNSAVDAIKHVLPAQCMVIPLAHPDKIKTHIYWQPPITETHISKEDATEQLSHLLKQSIQLHLRSDVPIGCALSGGLDSSIITCLVREQIPDVQLHTFSFIAKGSEADEEEWVDEVVNHTGVQSHKIIITPDDLLNDMEHFVRAQGEPCGGYSVYAQQRIFAAAKQQGITVMLEGQGADESWAGYWGYPEYRIQSYLKKGQFLSALKFLRSAGAYPQRSVKGLLARLGQCYISQLPSSLWRMARNLGGHSLLLEWADESLLKQHNVSVPWLYPLKFHSRNQLKNRMATELSGQKLASLLRHSDRAGMYSSIESRVPFLHVPLVEFALSLPEDHLLGGMQAEPKHLLKQATKKILPSKIYARKDKNGFEVPFQWHKSTEEWRREQLAYIHEIPWIDSKIFGKSNAQLDQRILFRLSFLLQWQKLNHLSW